MIKKEEQYFINRLNRFFPNQINNIDFVYSFAHYDLLIEEPAFYYPERGKDVPTGCFKVSRKKFNDYEKYTPFHFAGFAQMFGMDEEERQRIERQRNAGESTYFSGRWKLVFGDNNFDEINKRIEECKKDFEESKRRYRDFRFLEPEVLIAKAVQIINTELGKCNGGVRITDLFAIDPVGWTVPVKINFQIKTNEDYIGGKDTLGAYVYNAENSVLINDEGESINGYPYNLRSWIETDPIKLQDFALQLNADCKFLVRAYFRDAQINISEEHKLYDALSDIYERGFSFDDLVGIYVYVLAHEIFHAWQDYHIGLWHTSKNLASDKRKRGFEESETLAEFFAIHFVWSILKNKPLAFLLCANRMREMEYVGPNGYTDVVNKNVLCDNSKKDFFKELSAWEDLIIKECYREDEYLLMRSLLKLSSNLNINVSDLLLYVQRKLGYEVNTALVPNAHPSDFPEDIMRFAHVDLKEMKTSSAEKAEKREEARKERDFVRDLQDLIESHGYPRDFEICNRACLRKDTLSKLWKSHKNINRDWIWALGIALGLNIDEVHLLLKHCKKKDEELTDEEFIRETIIEYFIEKRKKTGISNVGELNEWLYNNAEEIEKIYGIKVKPLGNDFTL